MVSNNPHLELFVKFAEAITLIIIPLAQNLSYDPESEYVVKIFQ